MLRSTLQNNEFKGVVQFNSLLSTSYVRIEQNPQILSASFAHLQSITATYKQALYGVSLQVRTELSAAFLLIDTCC